MSTYGRNKKRGKIDPKQTLILMRNITIILVTLMLTVASNVTYGDSKKDQITQRIYELNAAFPYGMKMQDAKRYLETSELEYSVMSLERCSYNDEYENPEYRSRGGPCIVVLDRVYRTWYGFGGAITVKLWFNSKNILELRRIENENTFL